MWSALVLIAAIVAVVVLVQQRRNGPPGGMAGPRPARDGEREQELEAEIDRLRQRVQVLERIATDEHDTTRRLSDDIERLRDKE